MNRREAMRNVAFLFGGALTASTMSILFDSCTSNKQPGEASAFTPEQEALIAEIADTIIPATATPGAKAAGVGPFIAMMMDECYPEEDVKDFLKGLERTESLAKEKFSKAFADGSAEQRAMVLQVFADEAKALDEEEKKQKEAEKNKPKDVVTRGEKKGPAPFFKRVKELTMLGYFTSEIGATKALNYVAIPGKFESDYPLKAGDKAWAL